MKRNELKTLVKECLLEILMEGVANNSQKQNVLESKVEQRQPARRTALDHIIPPQRKDQQQQIQRKINDRNVEIAKNITNNDPVMSSIFADTASTTLREQVAADSGRSAPVNDTGVDPLSLFENAGNWASLAFSDSQVKRS